MKYKAIIETDDYKDFKFFEDGNGKYIHGIDAGAENNEWIVLYFKECKQEPILDKIRTEIIQLIQNGVLKIESGNEALFNIIDKYKTESGDKE